MILNKIPPFHKEQPAIYKNKKYVKILQIYRMLTRINGNSRKLAEIIENSN